MRSTPTPRRRRGALTVAASNFATPATPEAFSSRGPAFKRFDVTGNRLAAPEDRHKPDLTAADGVATSVPNFAPFFGTSAAAPSAAGLAALLLSAKPSLPVDVTASILKDSTRSIDCTALAGVPDLDCGFGFPLADAAVQSALDASPPVVAAVTTPAAPDGADGWFTSPSVGVSWSTTDPESPVAIKTGCDQQTVTAEGTTDLSCTATSAGGATTTPLAVKHDVSPPSAPTISGIAAQTFAAGQLPAQSAIGCSAEDATSGVSSCTVGGYDAAPGAHTLTATATNGAGLTSTASLDYTVAAPPRRRSRRSCSCPRSRRSAPAAAPSRRRASGARASRSRCAPTGPNTRLRLTAKLGKKTVGTLTKTVAKAGKATLRLKLSRAGKALLKRKRGKVAINVTGTAAGFRTTTLKLSVTVRR